MGMISKRASIEEDTTFFRVVGEVEAEQALSEIISFLIRDPTHLAIWDLAGGALQKLSAKDLKMIVERAARYTGSRTGGRTAIVCENDLDYGLSTMFQAFAKVYEVPIEIQVFTNRDRAQAWLDALPTSRDHDH